MNNAFELLALSFGAAACWALWFFFLKEQRLDSFREELFQARDQLFRLAESGALSFDSPSYTELRYLCNGMLRFGHRISFRSSLIASSMAQAHPTEESGYDRWKRSVLDQPQDVQDRLKKIQERVSRAYMRHLVNGSIILFSTALLFAAVAVIKHLLNALIHRDEPKFDIVDVAVNQIANSFNSKALEEQAYREHDSRDLQFN